MNKIIDEGAMTLERYSRAIADAVLRNRYKEGEINLDGQTPDQAPSPEDITKIQIARLAQGEPADVQRYLSALGLERSRGLSPRHALANILAHKRQIQDSLAEEAENSEAERRERETEEEPAEPAEKHFKHAWIKIGHMHVDRAYLHETFLAAYEHFHNRETAIMAIAATIAAQAPETPTTRVNVFQKIDEIEKKKDEPNSCYRQAQGGNAACLAEELYGKDNKKALTAFTDNYASAHTYAEKNYDNPAMGSSLLGRLKQLSLLGETSPKPSKTEENPRPGW